MQWISFVCTWDTDPTLFYFFLSKRFLASQKSLQRILCSPQTLDWIHFTLIKIASLTLPLEEMQSDYRRITVVCEIHICKIHIRRSHRQENNWKLHHFATADAILQCKGSAKDTKECQSTWSSQCKNYSLSRPSTICVRISPLWLEMGWIIYFKVESF